MLMPKSLRLNACQAIIEIADEARKHRANKRTATNIDWNGCAYTGEVNGSIDYRTKKRSLHHPSISLSLKVKKENGKVVRNKEGQVLFEQHRIYQCSCTDHTQRSHIYGPCKHVIALANAILDSEERDGKAA